MHFGSISTLLKRRIVLFVVALLLVAPGLAYLQPAGAAVAARSRLPLPTVPLPTIPLPTVPLPTVDVPPTIRPTVAVTPPSVSTPGVVLTPPVVSATLQPTLGATPGSLAAGVNGTASVCGPVTALVSPTSINSGSVSIGGQTLTLAPGSTISGAGLVVGSLLCLTYTTTTGGQIANGTITANSANTLHLCGPVSALTSPTNAQSGSVTIAGQTISLAPGAALTGAALAVGSTECLDVSTDPHGQISQGSISASAPTDLNLCGVVTAFTAPTNASSGALTIAGETLALAPGANFAGGAVAVGSNLCAALTTNPQGAITGGAITASVPTTLNLCGLVSAVLQPVDGAVGALTIGGQVLQLAPGAHFSGAGLIAGSNLCAVLTTDPQGQITGGVVSVAAPTALNLCGVVDAFTPPTTVQAGSLTIGGQTVALAPGAAFSGGSIAVGRELCGAFSTNPNGQVSGGGITVSAPTSLTLCGILGAYLAPTSVAAGTLTLAGQTLPVAPGASISGATAGVASTLCGSFTTNPQGQITGGTLSVSVPTSLQLCGVLSAFTSATSVTPGNLAIAGQTLILAPGAALANLAPQVGSGVCAALTTNPGGQVTGGTVTVQPPIGATLCAVVTAFVPPLQTAPGSITLGATVLVLPAGTTFPNGILVGQNSCVVQTGGGSGGPPSGGPGAGGPPGGGPIGSKATPGPGAGVTPVGGGSGNPTVTPSGPGTGTSLGRTATLLEYGLPAGAGPYHLEFDRHHNLWFTETRHGRVGELLAGTHTLRQFVLSSRHSAPHGLAIDANGAIWIAESAGNRIDRLTLTAKGAQLTLWLLPRAKSDPEHVVIARNGTVWITEDSNRIGHLDPRTGSLREYATRSGAFPHGIQMGAAGPVFVTERANTVVQARLLTGQRLQLTRLTLPVARARPEQLLIRLGRVWATERRANALVRVDAITGHRVIVSPASFTLHPRQVSRRVERSGLSLYRFQVQPQVSVLTMRPFAHGREYPLPQLRSAPYDLTMVRHTAGVWLSESRGNRVALVLPTTHRVAEYTLPQSSSAPKGIRVWRRHGRTEVWIAAYGRDRLAMLLLP